MRSSANTILCIIFIYVMVAMVMVECDLWPYGPGVGDLMLNKNNAGTQKPASKIFTLNKDIDMYGDTVSKLKIYENGVVSRDIHTNVGMCPSQFSRDSNILAFWTPTDISRDGIVYYRQEEKNGPNNSIDFDILAKEVARGAREIADEDYFTDDKKHNTLEGKHIESVVVITWKSMAQPHSFFSNPTHRNTFQILIIATTKGSYVHTVFDRIDYFQFHSYRFYCRQAAIFGLSESNYAFYMTNHFYLAPSNIRLHSNIYDFSGLGRYILLLKKGIKLQPDPPRLNCNSPTRDEFCITGLPKDFCIQRATGRYPHPSFCDMFVLCNGPITDVQECKGLVYNPWIQNCDWKHMYQCTSISFEFSQQFDEMERKGRMTRRISIKYDVIDLHLGIHNNTCVGVPNWGNAVDISSCDHYLMCSNTRTYIVPCPPSYDGSKLYYNPEKNYCDYQRNVHCVNGTRPGDRPNSNNTRLVIITPPPIVTRSTPKITTTPLPQGVNPCRNREHKNSADPFSCDHYYSCSHSKVLHRFRCSLSWNGLTLYYDEIKNQCVYRHETQCKLTSESTPTTSTTTTIETNEMERPQ